MFVSHNLKFVSRNSEKSWNCNNGELSTQNSDFFSQFLFFISHNLYLATLNLYLPIHVFFHHRMKNTKGTSDCLTIQSSHLTILRLYLTILHLYLTILHLYLTIISHNSEFIKNNGGKKVINCEIKSSNYLFKCFLSLFHKPASIHLCSINNDYFQTGLPVM